MDDRQQVSDGAGPAPPQPPPLSAGAPLGLGAFARYGEQYLAHHLHSVRLSRARRPDFTAARDRPLVVYFNHASWWDPLICLELATQVLPLRRHYAPIAGAPAADRVMARLGFYPLDPHPARDARRLLATAAHLLDEPDSTLWLTPGDLADPRQRPIHLHPWLGHLVRKLRRGVLLPLAIELPFWQDRRPEALLRFGEELAIEDAALHAHDWTTVLAAHLQDAQDALAAEALTRDPARFELLLAPPPAASPDPAARPGVGRVRGLFRRMRGLLPSRRLHPSRGPDS